MVWAERKDIEGDPPWVMLFADDLALIAGRKGEVEGALGKWRKALEDPGLRISREKTELLRLNSIKESVVRLGWGESTCQKWSVSSI